MLAPTRPLTNGELVERYADEIEANDQDERLPVSGRRKQALALARNRLQYENETARLKDVSYWAPRLARYALVSVRAAWPDCPLPRCAPGGYGPSDRPTALSPRPVSYDAATYHLDSAGIHEKFRPTPKDPNDPPATESWNYWVCSPVFQLCKGTNGNPNSYAVQKSDGTWHKVDVAASTLPSEGQQFVEHGARHDWDRTIETLVAAGLRLNAEPVHVDAGGERHETGRQSIGQRPHVSTWPAPQRLMHFLERHSCEAPLR